MQVAQLAGVPLPVIQRAREKLVILEKESLQQLRGSREARQAPLQTELFLEPEHPVLTRLKALNPDDLSARAALELLYELKRQL